MRRKKLRKKMKEYRIPKIEEFVQGFKYQIAQDIRMIIWSPSNGVTEESPEKRIWHDREVYWMGEPKELHTTKFKHFVETVYGIKEETSTLTVDGPTYDFFYRSAPYNIKSLLEQGLIRVEI